MTEPFPQQKESNREILWALSFFVSHDISLGGSCEDILHDLDVIKDAEKLGLFLNNSKSEIICHDHSIRGNHHTDSRF